MIGLVINNFFLFIKLFLFILIKILMFENTLAKCIMIFVIVFTLYLLFLYPKKRFHRLSRLRLYRLNLIEKYGLYTRSQHIFNILMIMIYVFILTGIVFYLRFLNKDKSLDLKQYYKFFIQWISENSMFELLLNLVLYLLLLMLYLILMYKISTYFKYHIVKRHLYFMNRTRNLWYYCRLFCDFVLQYNIFGVQRKIVLFIQYLYKHLYFKYKHKYYPPNYDALNFTEQVELQMRSPVEPDSLSIKYRKMYPFIEYVLKYSHYCLLLSLFIYDIWFNNFIITKIFYILPWIYFYDLYVRISVFTNDLHLPYDESFSDFVYAQSMEVINKNTLLLDGDFWDYNYFKRIYKNYVLRNFVKDLNDVS